MNHPVDGAHYASIIESSDDAIISKTLQGRVLTWNAAAQRIYGYSAEEMLGQSMARLLPPDRPQEEDLILEQIRRGERVAHFETVRQKKSGELIDVSLLISPVRDTAGVITAASHIARDITENKLRDAKLQHTQKLESLGVLAGGIAHDFNNLLTGIMGNTSVTLDAISTDHPMRGPLLDVLHASERLAHLTRQLLAYAGKGGFVIEPISLSELVREISALLQTSIPRNVQLRLELRDDLPTVDADAGQLQQVIMNLVINGAEAVPADTNGTVLVTTKLQAIDDQYANSILAGAYVPPGLYVMLEVHDTGCGMDAQTEARIFDPFFTTKIMGRGLGLAAVQGIVKSHRGALKVYSTLGKGTTFRVLLPVGSKALAAQTPNMAVFHTEAADQVIMVVDDEELIRRTAKTMLERHGYTVVLAENGRDGVNLWRLLREKVALVVLDMNMPVMNGEEAFAEFRKLSPTLKVVLSSGYNQADTLTRFSGKGLAGFVQKPYNSAALIQVIGKALSPSSGPS